MVSFYNEFKPIIELSVSATLLGILIDVKDKRNFNSDNIIITTPSHDHVDVEFTKPLTVDGHEQYLSHGDLKPSNGYCNGVFKDMMADAASKNRSLHVAMLSNRVNAVMNNTDCAEAAQLLHPNIVIAVMDGSRKINDDGIKTTGYKYRLPYNGDRWSYVTLNSVNEYNDRHELEPATVVIPQDLINQIDEYHLEAPLIIFCYKMHFKSFSIRNSTRACTHMTLNIGKAVSLSMIVQAFGRGQGEQKQLLANNGFHHVTILTTKADYESVRAHSVLLDEMHTVLNQGGTLHTAFHHRYSADADAFFNQMRTICAKNTGIEKPARMTFQEVTQPRFVGMRTNAAQDADKLDGSELDDDQADMESDDDFLDAHYNPNKYVDEADETVRYIGNSNMSTATVQLMNEIYNVMTKQWQRRSQLIEKMNIEKNQVNPVRGRLTEMVWKHGKKQMSRNSKIICKKADREWWMKKY